jgi:ubiquinone/menaquinone biosynthesis C-methylase UbiE
MAKLNYGVDGPKFVRNLFILSLLFYTGTIVLYGITENPWIIIGILPGLLCTVEGILMILYAKKGKFFHREKIIGLINWSGNEHVLDIGTGLGLLMIGAAKKLDNGRSVGMDIWNKDDLSQNSSTKAIRNAEIEGVADKVELRYEDIRGTHFPDASFDVILSNLCLHNVGSKANRAEACKEIYRILKKNGVAVISDFIHCSEYAREFEKIGMTTEKIKTTFLHTFQPLTIIKATKN